MTGELRRQNDKWNEAWLTKDVAAVERMAAGDYMYLGPQGQVLRRADILKIVRSRSYRLARGKWTGISISALGPDAGLVVDRFTGEGEYRGVRFTEDHRHTTVWLRRAGRWQVRLEQCSAITAGRSHEARQGDRQELLSNSRLHQTAGIRRRPLVTRGRWTAFRR